MKSEEIFKEFLKIIDIRLNALESNLQKFEERINILENKDDEIHNKKLSLLPI